MAIVPTLNGAIDAFASNPTQLMMDISSYFAPIAPLSITTPSLPSGTASYNYSANPGCDGRRYSLYMEHNLGSLPPVWI